MEPLNLTLYPPRGPRIALGGILMMARTVDKARALLPGGDPGRYYITPGLSIWLLGKLGFTEPQFLEIVARAQDDEEVAVHFRDLLPAEKHEKINRFITRFTLDDISEELQRVVLTAHPWDFPRDMPIIDLLEADDRRNFPAMSP